MSRSGHGLDRAVIVHWLRGFSCDCMTVRRGVGPAEAATPPGQCLTGSSRSRPWLLPRGEPWNHVSLTGIAKGPRADEIARPIRPGVFHSR
jgi:hypothetical protein